MTLHWRDAFVVLEPPPGGLARLRRRLEDDAAAPRRRAPGRLAAATAAAAAALVLWMLVAPGGPRPLAHPAFEDDAALPALVFLGVAEPPAESVTVTVTGDGCAAVQRVDTGHDDVVYVRVMVVDESSNER